MAIDPGGGQRPKIPEAGEARRGGGALPTGPPRQHPDCPRVDRLPIGKSVEPAVDPPRVKIRVHAVVRNKAVCLALGVLPGGTRDVLGAVFPVTSLQTRIVHLIRNSLDCARWKDRKLLAAPLGPNHTAANAEAATQALDEFECSPWGRNTPPTPSRACTVGCARSSRRAGTSPAVMRPPS